MNFLHNEFQLVAGDVIEFTLDRRANVLVLDDANYRRYRRGERYRCVGGHATQSPVRIRIPHPGHWHGVVDLGGRAGRVRAGIRALKLAG